MDRNTPKLLIIADQELSSRLSDYALKVAIRLDLEIIVLFLLDKVVEDSNFPHLLDPVCRYRDLGQNDTKKRIDQEAADFAAKAWKAGIKVLTVVDVEGKERAIAKIRRREPEIRFLLSNITEDKQEDDDIHGGHPRLRVLRQQEL